MPMTKFLFTYIKKTSKCHKDDNFTFKDWIHMLKVMKKTIAVNEKIMKMEFEPSPDCLSHENISLNEVIRDMLKISYD